MIWGWGTAIALRAPPVHAADSMPVSSGVMTLPGAAIVAALVLLAGVVFYKLCATQKRVQQAQETLEQNYTLLDTVFTHSPIGMMIQNAQRQVVRSNAALESILGIRPEVLDKMGVPLSSLISDDSARKTLLDAYHELLIHPSHMLKVKVPVRTPVHRDKWLLVNAQTLLKNGEIAGILWQVQDITREENALRELQRISDQDPLTGLLNRRAFLQQWRRERARAQRLDKVLSLVIIDLDFFKQINDRYGHQAGDEVLQLVSNLLRSTTRETDLIARFGGEEFALLLPDTDAQGAAEAAEKIRQVVAETPVCISSPTAQCLEITLSAGVAQWKTGETFETLYKKADEALYQAKHQGRNRVLVWGAQSHKSAQ